MRLPWFELQGPLDLKLDLLFVLFTLVLDGVDGTDRGRRFARQPP